MEPQYLPSIHTLNLLNCLLLFIYFFVRLPNGIFIQYCKPKECPSSTTISYLTITINLFTFYTANVCTWCLWFLTINHVFLVFSFFLAMDANENFWCWLTAWITPLLALCGLKNSLLLSLWFMLWESKCCLLFDLYWWNLWQNKYVFLSVVLNLFESKTILK